MKQYKLMELGLNKELESIQKTQAEIETMKNEVASNPPAAANDEEEEAEEEEENEGNEGNEGKEDETK